ncbi:MAG: endonuclease III [Ruminococcaceae bacterium]|nr:endonuclease III [Oscillospiraceae bacterium]
MGRMRIETKAKKAAEVLRELYPNAVCSLDCNDDPWKLLVQARLSAQCTDERVNIVSVGLFERFPDVYSMAKGELSEIEELIKSCGLFRGKAKNIKDSSIIIAEKFGGRVPDNMDDLLSLPGVGRKIANLIMGDVFGKGGIVADTHCMRISCRLGLCERKDPLHVERTLDPIVPKNEQSDFCHRMVWFGRDICRAQSPKCDICPMRKSKICNFDPQKEEK